MRRVLGLAISTAFLALLAQGACVQKGGPLKIETVEPPRVLACIMIRRFAKNRAAWRVFPTRGLSSLMI